MTECPNFWVRGGLDVSFGLTVFGFFQLARARPPQAPPVVLVRRRTDYIPIAFLPLCGPDLHPVEYLWAWLKRHAMANYFPNDLRELQTTARNRLKSAQK